MTPLNKLLEKSQKFIDSWVILTLDKFHIKKYTILYVLQTLQIKYYNVIHLGAGWFDSCGANE